MEEQSEKEHFNSQLHKISRTLLSEIESLGKNDHCHYEVIKNIKKLIEQTFDFPINFIFIGTTCSGKTSIINSLISLLTNYQYMNFLPTSICENTTGITVIENSKDESFHYIVLEGGNDKGGPLELPELQKILKKKKEQCEEELKIYKTGNCLEEIEKYDVIKIPNAKKKFTFIDTPGISNKFFLKYIENTLTNKNIIPIFINVINLNSVELVNENLLNILDSINKHFLHTTMYLILTQADLVKKTLGAKYRETIDDDEDENELEQNQETRKQAIIQTLNVYLKFSKIKIGKIFFLNSFLANKEKENQRTDISRTDFESFDQAVADETIQSYYQTKISFFTSKLISEIHKYEKQKSDSKTFFDSQEIVQITLQRDNLSLLFNKEIQKFLRTFPQTMGELISQYKFFSQLQNSFYTKYRNNLPFYRLKSIENMVDLQFHNHELSLYPIDSEDQEQIVEFICVMISNTIKNIIQNNYVCDFPKTLVQKIRAINNHHRLLNNNDLNADLNSGLLRLSGFNEKDFKNAIKTKIENKYNYFSEAVFGICKELNNFSSYFNNILINLETALNEQVELTEFSDKILNLKNLLIDNKQEQGEQKMNYSISSLLKQATLDCKLLEKDKLKSFFLDISDLMEKEEQLKEEIKLKKEVQLKNEIQSKEEVQLKKEEKSKKEEKLKEEVPLKKEEQIDDDEWDFYE